MPGNSLKVDYPRPDNILPGQYHHNAKPLIGKRFGKLEVVEERGRNSRRSITYLCLCDCGKSVVRVGSTLLCGKSVSCGCNAHSPENLKKRGMAQRKSDAVFRLEHRHYSDGAAGRDIQFALSLEEFTRLLLADCAYCGSHPNREIKSRYQSVLVNGIDRLDNTYGYFPVNCVSCCTTCNYMKRTVSRNEFIAHCGKVVRHSRKK